LQARQEFASDRPVRHDSFRRNWTELRPPPAGDLDRFSGLLAITVGANA
jgi:hypothetical protein